ncbi:hypothetical protein M8C21_029492, partial [Ambrosia artemisiifolia]
MRHPQKQLPSVVYDSRSLVIEGQRRLLTYAIIHYRRRFSVVCAHYKENIPVKMVKFEVLIP